VSWYQRFPSLSLALIRASVADPSAWIIDVGGGASTLVDALRAEGYESVAVLDIAEDALAAAKQRLGAAATQVEWIVHDVRTWRPEQRFALWHDRAVFHFMTEEADRHAYLATLKQALLPGGTAVIATFALDGPERCSGLPVRRYSPETLTGELGGGFSLLETAPEQHVTPAGITQSFIYCRFRRA
jgi:2-polyprenyl-3-methyl-5-hydroxy-6-metoxy-1,4-benzoquinol methylase